MNNATYHPRLVTEIVKRVQRVHAWQSSILQSNHYVPVVSILVHAESMLSDQHKVWLKGSGSGDMSKKYLTALQKTTSQL